MLAHNSPDLTEFYEAVRNHLETVNGVEGISTDGKPILCELINEQCFKMIQVV